MHCSALSHVKLRTALLLAFEAHKISCTNWLTFKHKKDVSGQDRCRHTAGRKIDFL